MAKTGTIGVRALVEYPISNNIHQTGRQLVGARALTREVAQEITNQFADNTIYDSVAGPKTITGELTTFAFHDEFYTDYLGFFKNINGGFTDSNKNVKKAGLAFVQDYKIIESGQMVYRVNVMYDVSFTEPSIDITTTEDAVEYTELVAAYSGKVSDFIVDDKGEKVSYFWFITPPDYSLTEVLAFLQEIPKPTSTLLPPKDVTPPVITVPVATYTDYTTAEDGTKTFSDLITDAGITANDDTDGDVTANITFAIGSTQFTASSMLPLGVVGNSIVTLNVSDTNLNSAIPKTITIEISI